MRTELDLLEAWRGGDRLAGNELFQRNFEPVRRFFANKVDRDVEDLVQRTFMVCAAGREKFEGRSTFRTYLFGIAHNVLREFYRRRNRGVHVDLEERSAADLGAGPTTLLAKHREERALLEALRRLPVELQVVLELYYWERLTGVELGEVLGVPENTARSRLRRAKARLLDALRQLESSGEVLASTTNDLDGWAASIRARLMKAG